MDIFSRIAERKIAMAIEQGEFDNLENAGKPLDLADDAWVPEDLRIAYRVLRNAGCLPPELELRNEIITLRDMMQTLDDDKERMRKLRELNFKLLKLGEMRKKPLLFYDLPEYEEKICQKLTGMQISLSGDSRETGRTTGEGITAR
ncbi:MAG TPA: DnaJ family domain-containing protein [Thermodesulfovibrionales bacterium]|nr:DnaJ family domain-containing protein [Thermodesulfovibrionales bacterium]